MDTDDLPFAESGDKDRYLITYADLITLLLGLFIILYAISSIDNNKYQTMMAAISNAFGKGPNPAKVEQGIKSMVAISPTEKLKGDLLAVIDKYNYSNAMRLEQNERGLTVHILEDLMFAPGKADLGENSKMVLKNLAVILRELPNDIRIEGHTDNIPINTPVFPSNWHLSVARATSTAYYLMLTEKLNPDKIAIVAYADTKPLVQNDTPENRSQNRRVDIVIVTK